MSTFSKFCENTENVNFPALAICWFWGRVNLKQSHSGRDFLGRCFGQNVRKLFDFSYFSANNRRFNLKLTIIITSPLVFSKFTDPVLLLFQFFQEWRPLVKRAKRQQMTGRELKGEVKKRAVSASSEKNVSSPT